MPLPKPLLTGLITLIIVISVIAGVFALLVGYVAWKHRKFENLTDTGDLSARMNEMAGTYLASRPRAALVIGVHQRGRNWVGGYGTVGATVDGRKPDGDTIFEIGSITKVFTGIALGDAVERGVVQLDDPLAALLPAEVNVESGPVREVTLKQLATHSAGVPRLPADFWEQAKENEANPYAGYTTAELFASLQSLKLNRAPGSGYEYSNYGTALLGQALAAKQGVTYAKLLQTSVLDPVGLTDTALVVPEASTARFVGGYSPKGESTVNWDFDAFAPAGGLRSTANDLLKFIRIALAPGDDPLGRALKRSLQVQSEVSGQKLGLGWHQLTTLEGLTLWWHNGGTGGYVSYLGLDPANQTGVIVLANYGDALAGKFEVDKMGVSILTLAAKVSLE